MAGSGAAHGNSPPDRTPSICDLLARIGVAAAGRGLGDSILDATCRASPSFPPLYARPDSRSFLTHESIDRLVWRIHAARRRSSEWPLLSRAAINGRDTAHTFGLIEQETDTDAGVAAAGVPSSLFRNTEVLRRRLPRPARKQAPHVRADVLASPYGRRQPLLPGLTTHFFASLLSHDVCLRRAHWPPAKRSPWCRRRFCSLAAPVCARFTRLRPFLAAPGADRTPTDKSVCVYSPQSLLSLPGCNLLQAEEENSGAPSARANRWCERWFWTAARGTGNTLVRYTVREAARLRRARVPSAARHRWWDC